MNEFIWRPKNSTNGVYEQSRKEDNPNLLHNNNNNNNIKESKKEEEANAIEEEQNRIKKLKEEKPIVDPNTFYDNNGVFRMSSSKREEANMKMNDRELISQRNQNPYLVQNNYIEDLETQQSFLIPKNSNFGDKKNL
jgi:hypothetical protein